MIIQVERIPRPGETILGGRFLTAAGGKGANQAYAAGRLGGKVSMVGLVGNDGQAELLRGNLASTGVDVSHVHCDPSVSSGIATITIDASGQNQIIIIPGSNGTFTPARPPGAERPTLLSGAGYVLLQLEIPMPTVLRHRMARKAGAIVILDPAPAQPLPDELLACVDYLTPNETELGILTGVDTHRLTEEVAAAKALELQKRGARKVIVKMGDKGALLVNDKGREFWPALAVKAVDTTAAGDAFNGAFAFALAQGKSEAEAGRFATVAAAISVTRPGAQPSMPTRAEDRQDAEKLKTCSGDLESSGIPMAPEELGKNLNDVVGRVIGSSATPRSRSMRASGLSI